MELEYLSCNPCAGFGVGEGVVVVLQNKSAGGCDSMKLMVV